MADHTRDKPSGGQPHDQTTAQERQRTGPQGSSKPGNDVREDELDRGVEGADLDDDERITQRTPRLHDDEPG